MGTKLSAADARAYEALDRLLFREWDPIGVSTLDGSPDEYRAYLPQFWQLLRSGAPETEIADYLTEIERERMGLETSEAHRMDIARKAAAIISGGS